jgi:hypothetical protein
MGLFVEARGSFTLANGSSTSQIDGDTAATSKTYKLAGSTGFGGGATIGYNITSGLALVGSFDYRSVKSREWSQTNQAAGAIGFGEETGAIQQAAAAVGGLPFAGGLATSTGNFTLQNTKNTMVAGLGIRPFIDLGPGQLFAGGGVAFVLPYEDKTTGTFSGGSGSITSASGERVRKWGMAIGMYGELGYNYSITENVYLGLNLRMLVATANNSGKTTTYTQSVTGSAGTATATTTVDNVDTTTGTTATTTVSGTSATKSGGQAAYASDGITDFSANVSVGFRF